MRQFTLRQRFGYWFDNTMARGPIALIGWLALLSAALIFVFSMVVWVIAAPEIEGQRVSFGELLWMSLLRTLDSGTMGGDQGSWFFLAGMLAVTMSGIFVVSSLIGIISTGVDAKIESLKKGRSIVVEHDHTVILGWSDLVYTIIGELKTANESRKDACVVILADRDMTEMYDKIRDKVGATGTTRVVCRSGSPIDIRDLVLAHPEGSKSIIVLAPAGPDADSQVIKTILAVTNNPNRRKEPYHIVAEIRESRSIEAARLVGGTETQLVESDDVIARLVAQTCRQSGLSVVYTELLDFGGDEIYFKEEPLLVGKTFGDSLLQYEDSCVMGVRKKDGRVLLNPPMGDVISAGDRIIAISEDDDTLKVSGKADFGIDTGAIRTGTAASQTPERTLVLGWNRRAVKIINELGAYVPPGSSLCVLADQPGGEEEVRRRCMGSTNQTVTYQVGDTTDRATLEALPLAAVDHVILLGYCDTLEMQAADSKTLITLLHLRDISAKRGIRIPIVSEMLDIRNRELAEVTKADDFIVSANIISLLISQVSEHKYLQAVFADLFDPEGSEIYMKPATDYVAPGKAVSFHTVVEAARRRSHVAIGYRIAALSQDARKAYGVVVNPDKSGMVTFTESDKIIVLAEN